MMELSLAGLGTEALSEGIKFLYAQAGEVLQRWWTHKDKTEDTELEPVAGVLPDLFEGRLNPFVVNPEAVAAMASDLEQLWGALAPYGQGLRPVERGNQQLLRASDALRRVLELVYQQRITFRGEPRATSGPVVMGELSAGAVAGEVAAVIAETIEGGTLVYGRAQVGDVEAGASAAAVRARRLGP